MKYVTVYEVSREYGGPEEGGWWFDTGHPVYCEAQVTEEQAQRRAEELRLEYPNTGKRYSVLGGDDYSVRIEDRPGTPYPEERPRYE